MAAPPCTALPILAEFCLAAEGLSAWPLMHVTPVWLVPLTRPQPGLRLSVEHFALQRSTRLGCLAVRDASGACGRAHPLQMLSRVSDCQTLPGRSPLQDRPFTPTRRVPVLLQHCPTGGTLR